MLNRIVRHVLPKLVLVVMVVVPQVRAAEPVYGKPVVQPAHVNQGAVNYPSYDQGTRSDGTVAIEDSSAVSTAKLYQNVVPASDLGYAVANYQQQKVVQEDRLSETNQEKSVPVVVVVPQIRTVEPVYSEVVAYYDRNVYSYGPVAMEGGPVVDAVNRNVNNVPEAYLGYVVANYQQLPEQQEISQEKPVIKDGVWVYG